MVPQTGTIVIQCKVNIFQFDVFFCILVSIDNKAMFFYLRGQTLNVLSAYDQHAEECLSKAVKLDPNLIEAWNELGESYWKNRNIEAAANCFTGAIAKVFSHFVLVVFWSEIGSMVTSVI